MDSDRSDQRKGRDLGVKCTPKFRESPVRGINHSCLCSLEAILGKTIAQHSKCLSSMAKTEFIVTDRFESEGL